MTTLIFIVFPSVYSQPVIAALPALLVAVRSVMLRGSVSVLMATSVTSAVNVSRRGPTQAWNIEVCSFSLQLLY